MVAPDFFVYCRTGSLNNLHTNQREGLKRLDGRSNDALSGNCEFLLLEINAYAQIGLAQDVYPSE